MKTKDELIASILSRDLSQIRKAAGITSNIHVLCYIDNGKLKAFTPAGECLDIATPKEMDIDLWADFLLRFNLVHFNDHEGMQDFINEKKPLPRHEYQGIPSWLWLLT